MTILLRAVQLPEAPKAVFVGASRFESQESWMTKHVAVSAGEAADRLAIRELIEAYAHCADRRDAHGQMALFTPDTHFVVYMNAKDPKPSQELPQARLSLPFSPI
jgi:hypothetical protein